MLIQAKLLDESISYIGQFNSKVGNFKRQEKWIVSHKQSGSKEVFATLANNKTTKNLMQQIQGLKMFMDKF